MSDRVLLTVSYDGTGYCGWQTQANGISVQEKLNAALTAVFGKENGPVNCLGASRTDAGVHARGQRALFSVTSCKIPPEKLPAVLNGFLPRDIVVTGAERVDEKFHPIFDAVKKTYLYQIDTCVFPDPLCRDRFFVGHPLDFSAMREAAAFFEGTHDFAAFRASGGSTKTTVRTIYSINLTQEGSLIRMEVCGNGFLYNMVRIMAGTLIQIGEGKAPPEAVSRMLSSKNRADAGKTAPPEGLTLLRVEYK